MSGQREPLRLTPRGETVVEALKIGSIFVILACFWAICTMIGY